MSNEVTRIMDSQTIELATATGTVAPGRIASSGTLPEFVLTYPALVAAVRDVSLGLAIRGVLRGDVVALCAPNCVEFVVAWFAATSIGAIVTTIDPLVPVGQIRHQLREWGACWLVTSDELYDGKLHGVADGAGIIETYLIGTGSGPSGAVAFESLTEITGAEYIVPRRTPPHVAYMDCSTGAARRFGNALLTHRDLIADLCRLRLDRPLTEGDVVVAALPRSHIEHMQTMVNVALLQGASVALVGSELEMLQRPAKASGPMANRSAAVPSGAAA
jgi:acyl-CoA synthetase (AMP-forming)/AMP-acid ligase II